MAEQQTTATTTSPADDGGSTGKTIAIVVGVLILLGLGAYFLIDQSNTPTEDQGQAQEQVDEVAKQAKEAEEEAKKKAEEKAAMQKDLDKEVELFALKVEAVRPILSANGIKSLDVIVLYVENEPVALLSKKETYPPVIQTAIDVVQVELTEAVGVVKAQKELEDAVVGQIFTLQGVLEASENEDPLGLVFSLVNNENSVKYYFVFNEEDTKTNMKLVSEEVTLDVKVTTVDLDGSVTYVVVSGPTKVEATETTDTVETTPTE